MITIKMSREDNKQAKEVTIDIEDFINGIKEKIINASKYDIAESYESEAEDTLKFLMRNGIIDTLEYTDLQSMLWNAMDDFLYTNR